VFVHPEVYLKSVTVSMAFVALTREEATLAVLANLTTANCFDSSVALVPSMKALTNWRT